MSKQAKKSLNVDSAFVAYGSEAWRQARQLRYDLFFKVHNLPRSVVTDSYEKNAYRYAICKGQEVKAYGRLHIEDKVAYVSQMVMRRECQGQGLGRYILSALIGRAKEQHCVEVALNARASALHFYTKSGFMQVGKAFDSATTGILHIPMALRFNRLWDLSGCQSLYRSVRFRKLIEQRHHHCKNGAFAQP